MLIKRVKGNDLVQMFKSLKTQSEEEHQKTYTEILKKLSWIPCSLASRYRRFNNYQDILQTGYLTLFRAMLKYDLSKSANVMGYVYPWVKSEIRREAWHHKEYLAKFQLMGDAKVLDDEIVPSPEENFIRDEEKRLLRNILKKLDNVSEEVIIKTFDLDSAGHFSLRQIAKEINFSHEKVRKLQIQALKKMAAAYAYEQRIKA